MADLQLCDGAVQSGQLANQSGLLNFKAHQSNVDGLAAENQLIGCAVHLGSVLIGHRAQTGDAALQLRLLRLQLGFLLRFFFGSQVGV